MNAKERSTARLGRSFFRSSKSARTSPPGAVLLLYARVAKEREQHARTEAPLMELRHLRYFTAVAEHGHFGRAAQALHTAQPSLSHQIRQLESELGIELFDRTTRRVQLTPAGEALLTECRRLFLQLGTSIESVRAVARGARGLLRVGFVSGAMGSGALPRFLHDFQVSHPKVVIDARPMTALAQISALREQTLHIGFLSAAYQGEGLDDLLVWTERLVLALPDHHPLVRRKLIGIKHLQHERLIIYSRTSGSLLQNVIVALLHEEQITPEVIQEGTDAETVIGLVAAGRGMSLVPESWSAFHFPGVTYRVVQPVRWIKPGMALFWNPDEESPLVTQFVASAQTTLKTSAAIRSLKVSIVS